MNSFQKVLQDIAKKQFSSIYFLAGEEQYFIDKLYEEIEARALNESEKSFNMDVFYAPEVKLSQVVAAARGYPMMAERRLVVVKELHRAKKDDLETLTPYIEKPVASTVLVLIYKDKKLPDGRSRFMKAIKSNALFFESQPLYEKELLPFVQTLVQQKGFSIDNQALHVLIQFLGNNLQIIDSELQKTFMFLNFKKQKHITLEIIYEMINIDKDFNVFQLIDAIAARNLAQSHLIIDQMSKNFKEQPPLLIIPQLYKFFLQVGILKQKNLLSEKDIAQYLQLKPFFATKYRQAVQNYNLTKIKKNILYLLQADLALKGITSSRMGEYHIMKTLTVQLLQE